MTVEHQAGVTATRADDDEFLDSLPGGATTDDHEDHDDHDQDGEAPHAGDGQRSVRIPHAPESVPAIRDILHADLTARGVAPQTIEEVETVASELLANAVRHAKALGDGCVRVRWKVKAGTVDVEVSDGGGPTTVRPVPPSPWANSGRGLRIVRSLAHEWGVQDDKNGRTVWAALGGPSRRRRL